MASTGTAALSAQVKPLYPVRKKRRKAPPKTSGRKKQ